MENLTLLGIIYVVVGLVLSMFIFVTLVLLIFGLILMLMGRKNTNYGYARFPMFMTCPACGKYIETSNTICPQCQSPTSVDTEA